MKILIIGTGYVGLVTGACLAEMGHGVTCLDIDKIKIEKLKKGIIPIYEPGLDEYIKRNTKAKRLFFSLDYKASVQEANACFICVPTPSSEDGSCNTGFIQSVAKEIGRHINNYKVIVNKSTCPMGSAFMVKDIIKKELKKRKTNIEFDVVSNPEFLKEGSAILDFMKPDRIVFGVETKKASNIMRQIYDGFTFKQDRVIEMDILSSEMTKYAANAMLATRISFMNEIALICKKIGANVNNVRKGIGSDSRIGYSFLYPGVGYGGSCFPKDIRALYHAAKNVGIKASLLETVDSINNRQKEVLTKNIVDYFAGLGGVKDKTIAVWGLAFKPDTDDMREAPALTLIKDLLKKGAKLKLYDPVSMDNAKKLIEDNKNIIWCDNEHDAANGADAIALLTEWKQFRLINFNPILKKVKHPAIFDGRNQYHPKKMQEMGFNYIGIGIPDHLVKK